MLLTLAAVFCQIQRNCRIEWQSRVTVEKMSQPEVTDNSAISSPECFLKFGYSTIVRRFNAAILVEICEPELLTGFGLVWKVPFFYGYRGYKTRFPQLHLITMRQIPLTSTFLRKISAVFTKNRLFYSTVTLDPTF